MQTMVLLVFGRQNGIGSREKVDDDEMKNDGFSLLASPWGDKCSKKRKAGCLPGYLDGWMKQKTSLGTCSG